MTAERRRAIALALFVLDVLGCGIWVYREAMSILDALGAGSAGIAGVSVSGGVVEGMYTVVPPIVTILLARASGSRLARHWRNAHLAVTLALIILPMLGGLRMILVSIAVFLPVQVFFVIGSVAIWFANPRKGPDTSSEAAT